MSEQEATYWLEVTSGVEGPHVGIYHLGEDKKPSHGKRICGPKAWGGGRELHHWLIQPSDLRDAIPELKADHENAGMLVDALKAVREELEAGNTDRAFMLAFIINPAIRKALGDE